MKKTDEKLGQRIERFRGDRTQQGLADAANLPRRTYQNIEDGTTADPGVLKISQIATALEVSIGELIGERPVIPREMISRVIEAPESMDPLRLASLLIQQFADAPPKLRAVVLAYLFQDFEIMRKYQKEIAALAPRPK